MKKSTETLMRFGAWLGGTFAFLLIGCSMVFVLMLVLQRATAAGTPDSIWTLLPDALRMTGFTLSTAVAAVVLSVPMAWAMATLLAFVAPPRLMYGMRNALSGLSAIPAVVFGYMGLCYFAPRIDSPWWCVTLTLMLMSLMRHTMELLHLHQAHLPTMEAAQALGAFTHEIVMHIVLPRAWRDYLSVALRMLVRCLGEGVAILLVLFYYGGKTNTLSSALMQAAGVTGEAGSVRWVLLLVLLLFALVMITNSAISYLRGGGRHGKKKMAQ